ncbi:hypothetical protein GPECTOR_2g1065 [Gonium pectorale]|uniref:Uncharacterized protein n=1 Tax=Gonium pectorale TaxID=33097 RepID=A0A150H024_GONPE|nr:hypothetical protein GPECTOR_2g1065 [Gonium pectorale]|eukprot:KXZ55516.1 hypothetical protein GPECTOR_2g1065 [Gonium pectorale]
MLASGSKDGTAMVWSVASPSRLVPLHVLPGHNQAVGFTAWSPDDRRLITCSEETVRVWDVQTGRLLHVFSHHSQAVSCCAWLPGGRRFLTGGTDRLVVCVDLDAVEAAAAGGGAAGGAAGTADGRGSGGGGGGEPGVQRWKRPYRVQADAENGLRRFGTTRDDMRLGLLY